MMMIGLRLLIQQPSELIMDDELLVVCICCVWIGIGMRLVNGMSVYIIYIVRFKGSDRGTI